MDNVVLGKQTNQIRAILCGCVMGREIIYHLSLEGVQAGRDHDKLALKKSGRFKK